MRADFGVFSCRATFCTHTLRAMCKASTIGDLVEEGAISDAEVRVAVMAFMAGVPGEEFVIARGYALDLTAAVAGHPLTVDILESPAVTEEMRRAAVLRAILLARPEKR
ncbi:hypothetical protein [Methylobacterium soli]|uniref:Uncharacterized protein n=1 Tax=Methylobacterium soli TaxID=553447 RepID=A0A6L3SNI0_9HYPH|nr:hypothetical protein [Methylobacterium soli]KAB1068906.1 hypothetical protein F6X53_31255 [Methylobacterium soli]GJE46666.1 hypothetical protein AEGHOMDF_5873 [Methylobacterium soli]